MFYPPLIRKHHYDAVNDTSEGAVYRLAVTRKEKMPHHPYREGIASSICGHPAGIEPAYSLVSASSVLDARTHILTPQLFASAVSLSWLLALHLNLARSA